MCVCVFLTNTNAQFQETQRQATLHDGLPRLLGAMGDYNKLSEKVYDEDFTGLTSRSQGKTKIYCTGTTSPANHARKDPCYFVLFETPFTSVSTVRRGHCSLGSLSVPYHVSLGCSTLYLSVVIFSRAICLERSSRCLSEFCS